MYRHKTVKLLTIAFFALTISLTACGDDEPAVSNASDLGIGGTCAEDGDCKNEDLTCLTNFKGGYCGSTGCTENADCPEGGICVAHDDGSGVANYCFLTCAAKTECNENRDADSEANCSGSFDYAATADDDAVTQAAADDPDYVKPKACVPPSS